MNADSLSAAIHFLHTFIAGRINVYSGKVGEVDFNETAFYKDNSPLSQFLEQNQPSVEEYILLLLALAPHIQPNLINRIIAEHLPDGGDFPEFGGVKVTNHRGILLPAKPPSLSSRATTSRM